MMKAARGAGIYAMRCIANGKLYVGRTYSFRKRLAAHVRDLRGERHANPHLQRAWLIYGEESFTFEVLEIVTDAELRREREAVFARDLGALDPRTGFNLKDPGTDLPEMPDPPKPEGLELPPPREAPHPTPARRSESSLSDETRQKMSRVRKGKPKSAETRLRMEVSANQRKGEGPFNWDHVNAIRKAYTNPLYHRQGGIALLARHLELPYQKVYNIVTLARWSDGTSVDPPGPFQGGYLHVIAGPMYASKSTELLRLLRKAKGEGREVLCVKPEVDTRRDLSRVTTHSGRQMDAVRVDSSREILSLAEERGPSVLGIDEAQFFDKALPEVCETLTRGGVDIYACGVNLDYKGHPFGVMPILMAQADSIDHRVAFCTQCGHPATRSFRVPEQDHGAQVQVGSDGVYEARCRACWTRGMT